MVNVLQKKYICSRPEGKILQSTNKKYTYDKDGKISSTQSKLKTFDKKTE